ncbi:MAG: ATP-binding protein [Planctomycetota bacterium]
MTTAAEHPAGLEPAEADVDANAASAGVLAPDDLAEVIQAYSAVAERLQASHEALSDEVIRLQKELAAKNAQLERSKRLSALGEMAAGIAHEIRNPLAAIQLYAEMVADDLAPGSVTDESLGFAADNTHKIADAVRGLSAIVNDVLSFARQIEPNVQALDAGSALQRVVDAHRPAIESHRIAVAVQLKSDVIHADADLLHQALLNLVRNAVDAMAEQRGGQLQIVVEPNRVTLIDTGPGLPQEVADRIFNPFFTTRSTGTGLGLAIVHRIIDAHGGTIAVHNHADHGGAIFILEFPSPADDFGSAARGVSLESQALEPAA